MMVEWKERLVESPIEIGLLGVIGSGKSTISAKLGERLGLIHVEETFSKNPFLERFYDNPQRWSFESQVWFLEKKIKQLKSLDPSKRYLIDPDAEGDRLFAKTLARIGFMSPSEFGLYDDLFETLVKDKGIRKPNLYLLVDAKLPVLRERIVKRGRPFEMKMLAEYPFYLSELSESIRNFAYSQKDVEVLHVNANNDNFVDDIHLKGLAEKIKRKI